MSPAALVFAVAVLCAMSPIAVVAVLWPAALARLNAAGLRSLPVAAPKKMREQAASNSTPGSVRLWGVATVGIITVIGANLLGIVREGGIEEPSTTAKLSFVWMFYLIGVGQVVFGVAVLMLSRRIFERLRVKFEEEGATLRRWMVIVVGAVGIGLGATVLYVAISLT
jgi:hypothetical protein